MPTNRLRIAMVAAIGALLFAGTEGPATSVGQVTTRRVPEGGLQPQAAVDEKGVTHLLYFKGDPAGGDLFYTRSSDGGMTFAAAIPVNSQPGSAIAVGSIRGAHLALGQNGRVHVAWMGSKQAKPRGPEGAAPMLYTRSQDAGTAFEPQRNVIQFAYGLDGGGSVAADGQGNVYVAWHADAGMKKEEARRVFVARSTDGGRTFAREAPAWAENTGACSCCGMRALADRRGNLYVLYRSAAERVHRDMYVLFSKDRGAHFQAADIHPWPINYCVMSSSMLVEAGRGVWGAWETQGQVYWAPLDPATGRVEKSVAAPGEPKGRKHPALAANPRGEILLAWTEGMAWRRGGTLRWQVFDASGRPTAEKGEADGVPADSLVAAFARPDGGFTVIY